MDGYKQLHKFPLMFTAINTTRYVKEKMSALLFH